jgi:hypothetical protein
VDLFAASSWPYGPASDVDLAVGDFGAAVKGSIPASIQRAAGRILGKDTSMMSVALALNFFSGPASRQLGIPFARIVDYH